ncbi:DNA polymerase-4 [Alteribacillus persepolensis]|uniref:DNA polymerase IV n=1 Tax=Alteribacillus persepolensis TaxID=568899 RepID=A0A1G8K6C5_9BACI|nr:DNA polymerase IV [Alteribacillus persepolensis]SDI38972.1 DNA polymerase-4 [Alteribacillus persepolensis]
MGHNWKGRVIFHVDMNSFYASVERVYDSSLKGKPLAIAGDPKERRGIVVTSSYEARAYGVKTTMPVWEARKKCPDLIVRPPDFDKYRKVSSDMFQLLQEYTDLVEPVSIDEGYMDMTLPFKQGSTVAEANHIMRRLERELGLPASIGIAPNKFLAKMASDMKKPLGITILRKRDAAQKLWPLPIEEMHGIGQKTADKLKKWNIHSIGDLARFSPVSLQQRFGVKGRKWNERANGIDERLVDPDAANEIKSVGNSTTLEHDEDNPEALMMTLEKLSEKVEMRMKRKQVTSWTIQLTIRYNDRKTITRSKTNANPLFTAKEMKEQAKVLLHEHWSGKPVRLLGVTALHVVPVDQAYKQLDLFSYQKDEKEAELSQTVSHLTDKYGEHIISKGLLTKK